MLLGACQSVLECHIAGGQLVELAFKAGGDLGVGSVGSVELALHPLRHKPRLLHSKVCKQSQKERKHGDATCARHNALPKQAKTFNATKNTYTHMLSTRT